MPIDQAERYHMSMAGEYLVASQLHRLGVHASITYGNSKGADIIATSGTVEEDNFKATVIEVKTSTKGRWPVGGRVPEGSNQIWVFVDLPINPATAPVYYVMTQHELRQVLKPIEDTALANFVIRNGEPYGDRPGVAAMTRKLLQPFEGHWYKVKQALGI